jgi:hypothetical protein
MSDLRGGGVGGIPINDLRVKVYKIFLGWAIARRFLFLSMKLIYFLLKIFFLFDTLVGWIGFRYGIPFFRSGLLIFLSFGLALRSRRHYFPASILHSGR